MKQYLPNPQPSKFVTSGHVSARHRAIIALIDPGSQALLSLVHISDYSPFAGEPYLPPMITQHKTRIAMTVTGRFAKLIEDLLLFFLAPFAVPLNGHRCRCLSLFHR